MDKQIFTIELGSFNLEKYAYGIWREDKNGTKVNAFEDLCGKSWLGGQKRFPVDMTPGLYLKICRNNGKSRHQRQHE